MSASRMPGGSADAENELLARLGLPLSATPEDVDQLHLAVSQYLAAAPSGLKGWAHAQASALDEAYLKLTDPVGLQGSALRSPARPPTVVPGGPATPPARRGPVPEALVAAAAVAPVADVADDDLEALYASVTPSAHRDMLPGAQTPKPVIPAAPAYPAAAATSATVATRKKRVHSTTVRQVAVPVAAPSANSGRWKKVALGAGVIVAAAVLALVVYNFGGVGQPTASADTAGASPTAPAVDMAKVSALMQKIAANPQDVTSLLGLGDEYYAGQQFTTAAGFYDQVLAIDPKNLKALQARGAVAFNTGDLANAQKLWNQAVAIDPNNQELHYDLGFLYMNQASPDWKNVVTEWDKVIAIDPTTQLATTVQSHLTSLVAASMIPAPSGSVAPAASGGASAAPSVSPSASAAPSASASTKP
jgi:cytochrome c-type biogenesis protein CcmH/NrfG